MQEDNYLLHNQMWLNLAGVRLNPVKFGHMLTYLSAAMEIQKVRYNTQTVPFSRITLFAFDYLSAGRALEQLRHKLGPQQTQQLLTTNNLIQSIV